MKQGTEKKNACERVLLKVFMKKSKAKFSVSKLIRIIYYVEGFFVGNLKK